MLGTEFIQNSTALLYVPIQQVKTTSLTRLIGLLPIRSAVLLRGYGLKARGSLGDSPSMTTTALDEDGTPTRNYWAKPNDLNPEPLHCPAVN